MQADNVREQLKRTMERFEVELISVQDQKKMFLSIRQALCCGFFMQVAHKEGEKGNYMTIKDNQVHCDGLGWVSNADGFYFVVGRGAASIMRAGHAARVGGLQ